jgi:hypothetical protein
VEAMNELLKSLDPSIKQHALDTKMASNMDGGGMDMDPGAQTSKPESEDEAAPAGDPSRIQPVLDPLAGALDDNVPTVRVDKKGRAYLTQSEVIFPKRDEVWPNWLLFWVTLMERLLYRLVELCRTSK